MEWWNGFNYDSCLLWKISLANFNIQLRILSCSFDIIQFGVSTSDRVMMSHTVTAQRVLMLSFTNLVEFRDSVAVFLRVRKGYIDQLH